MSDDLAISDFADQLHDDLLVKRLTDSDNTGFLNDLEKGASVDEVPKTASGGFFYSLVEIVDDNRVLVRVCEYVFVSCGDASRGDCPARPLRGAVASVPSWARANLELQVIKQ